jgi:hypothetical protein
MNGRTDSSSLLSVLFFTSYKEFIKNMMFQVGHMDVGEANQAVIK